MLTPTCLYVPGNRCLDIGCGSGYLTACMGLLVAPKGKAIGIDHIQELVDFSKRNIQQDQPDLLRDGVVEFVGEFLSLSRMVVHF